jgi:hypothetical protein
MNDQSSSQMKLAVMENARNGLFDHNPLLSTAHTITCERCQHSQSVVYLDYFKRGAFEVGTVERIEVLDTSGPFGILETQQLTPIIISVPCTTCGSWMDIRPVSLEYLSILLNRPRPSRAMYA